jgi:hypothetical protein
MDRKKWEMCVVSTDPSDAYVEYWDQTGPDRKSLAAEAGGTVDATYQRVRRVLGQLGDAGWELAGVNGKLLYFKRQKA